MKQNYKGCEIECFRGGDEFLSFSIFDDGYEVASGFSESKETVRDYMYCLKQIVDDYRNNPKEYIDNELINVI